MKCFVTLLWLVSQIAVASVAEKQARTLDNIRNKRQKRLLLNNDGTNLFWRQDVTEEMIRRHAEECPDVVTTYLLCPNSIQTVMYPSAYERLTARGNLRELVASGKDPFGLFLRCLKQRGFEVFITFRMNEVHNVDNPEEPDLCNFWRNHPEYRVEPHADPRVWETQCLDYSQQAVRERTLCLIEELLEKYVPDGIELDWMRFPRHLSGNPDEVWEKRFFLTDVVRRVREKTRALSDKLGRDILLSVRIPTNMKGCRTLGLDIRSWAEEGLIDFVTAAPFLSTDFSMPLAELREELADANIPIYAGMEFGYNGLPHTESTFYGAALGLYENGADGIYLFNFPCWREYQPHPPWAWLAPLKNMEQLCRLPISIALLNTTYRVPNVDLPPPLPRKLRPQEETTLEQYIPKALFAENSGIKNAHVQISPDGLDIAINGNPIEPDKGFTPSLLHEGLNRITIRNNSNEIKEIQQMAIHITPTRVTGISTICPSERSDFVISPEGSDDNPGTMSAPFQTLHRAQVAVRELLAQNIDRDIYVVLRGGTYYLNSPLVFTPQDCSSTGTKVIYRAYPGETPIVSGGMAITSWQQHSEQMWKAHVPVGRMRHLFINNERKKRARKNCEAEIARFGDWEHIDGKSGFIFPDGSMAEWSNPGDMELGFFTTWAHMICKVDSISRDNSGRALVFLRQPQCYLANLKEGVQIGQPDYIENASELLDEPGEWFFNRSEQILYYLPRLEEDMTCAQAVVPVLEKLIWMVGTPDAPVQNLFFEGLHFAHTTWLLPEDKGHIDVQANFTIGDQNLFQRDGKLVALHNEYTKSPGAIVARYTTNCRWEKCTFTHFGGAGLDLEQGAQDNLVYACVFQDISGNAIQIGDVTREDHHPADSRSIVRNNHILGCKIQQAGAEYEGSVGIFGGYTNGTVIAYNEIHDLPYSGISLGWGWGEEDAGGGAYEIPFRFSTPTPAGNNHIEHNHIYRVMTKRDDGGAIYTLGNQPGSVIRCNYIHDCGLGRPGGIYLDEGSGYFEITRNVVHDVATPIFYNNRAQNRIETCYEHDNYFDIVNLTTEMKEITEKAGLTGLLEH